MITAVINGDTYTDFISVSLGQSLSAIARDFNIVVAQPQGNTLPFKGGESIQIFIDNELNLEGSIFRVDPIYSKDSHTISISGRSKVADLIDSTLLALSLSADMSLQKIIEQVIKQLGLTLSVQNQVSGLEDFKKAEDKISAEPGDNAFEFIDKLARKRQVLLTSDAPGNIIITRNGKAENKTTLNNPVNGTSGNIISSTISYDMSNRYNKYVVKSQKNGSADFFGGNLDPVSFVDQKGEQIDSSIRVGRQLVMQAEKSSTDEQSAQRAIWNANIARVNSRKYSVILQGVRPKKGSPIWEVNKLQPVKDDQAGIDEIMLINSIKFTQSKAAGTRTQLGLVEKDAYTVELSQPIPSEKKDSPFANFN